MHNITDSPPPTPPSTNNVGDMKIVAMFFMIFGAALLANCICLCCFQCFVRRVFNVLETLAMAASGGGGNGTGVVGGGSIVAVPPGNGNPTALVLVERNEVVQSSTGPASDTGKINPPQSTTPRKTSQAGSRGQGSRASTAYSKPSAKDLAAAVKL